MLRNRYGYHLESGFSYLLADRRSRESRLTSGHTMNSHLLLAASWKVVKHPQSAGYKKVLRTEGLRLLASKVVHKGQKYIVKLKIIPWS